MSTIGLCALPRPEPGRCGLVQLFSADGLRRQSGGISSAFGALCAASTICCVLDPSHEMHADSRLTRMTVDVDSRPLSANGPGAATSLVTMAIAATMFWLDPIPALTVLSAVPVAALATMIYRRLSTPAYAQARLEIGKVNSTLQKSLRHACRAIAWSAGTGGAPGCARYRSVSAQPVCEHKIPLQSIFRS